MSHWEKAFALTLLIPITGYSICAGTWSGATSGSWDVLNNWSPSSCVPGSVTNTDSATFGSTVGASSSISLDAVPIDPGLGVLIFNNSGTSFTINSTTHFLQFNGASSSIEVLAGSHFLNTPVKVNNTVLSITATDLTLEKPLTEAAASTSSISFNGPGQLLNEMNSITVNGNLSVTSGTVTNSNTAAVVAGTGSLVQAGSDFLLSGGAYVNSNSGPVSVGAVGSSTDSLTALTINAGTLTVINTGAVSGGNGSFLGSIQGTINGGVVTFQNTGPISNAGAGTFFSITDLTINGGLITNSNTGSVTGPFSMGSFISVLTNLVLNGGTLINTGAIGSLIEAQGAFTINGGALVNNATVWTPLLTIGGAGKVTGSGLFQNVNGAATTQVVNGGIVIPGGPGLGDSPGVITIQGSYSQSGTLGINILNGSSFSQLAVTGGAQLSGNLEVAFSPGAVVTPGETFSIVQANPVTGIFSHLINFNIPNLAIQVRYLPTSVLLSFTPAASSYPNYFEALFASNNHINQRLERQMGQLRNRFYERVENTAPPAKSRHLYFMAEEPAAIKMTPISNFPLQNEKQQLAFFRYGQTEEKQEQLKRNISAPECLAEDHPWNFYFGPTGDIGDVLTKKDAAGFNYWSAGALTGFEYAFSQVGVGMLFNYDHVKGDVAHHWGKFEINQAHANLYATYAPRSMPEFALNAILGGGYNWTQVRRNAGIETVPAVGKGSPHGGEFDALLGLEYALDHQKICAMPESLQVIPLASIQYSYLYAGKYREHGAGLFDLKFHSQAAKSLRSTLGARLNYTWQWKNVVFTPEFNLGWQREFLDKGRSIGFSPVDFAVPAASLKMPRSGRNVALTGVDFLVTLFDKYGIEASYDFEWNSLYHDQFFYIGCNFRY